MVTSAALSTARRGTVPALSARIALGSGETSFVACGVIRNTSRAGALTASE
jgi:hypothetical protein